MTKQHEPPRIPPPYLGYPVPFTYPPEDTVDWSTVWRIVVQQRLLIIAITLAGTVIATTIAFLMTPIYRAEVLLAPAQQETTEGLGGLANQLGDLPALAGINLGSRQDKTAEHVAALKSRALSVSFIKKDNLMPVLFADQWDKQHKRWKDSNNPPTEWKAFDLWDNSIRRVTWDRRSGLVTLAIEWRDPVLAARWANDLVKEVNTRLRVEAVAEANKSIAYLKKELSQTSSVEVQRAIYRLIEGQTKNKMVANTREEYAFTTIDPAVVPERKYKPRRSVLVFAGLLLGLTLGFGAAIIASRRRGAAGVEGATGT